MITLLSGCRGNEMVPGTTHTGTRNVSVYIPDTTQITREKTGNCNVCRNACESQPSFGSKLDNHEVQTPWGEEGGEDPIYN